MNIKSQKLRTVLIMATLSLSTICLMNDMVIIPVADNLFVEFADAGVGVINYILSGPALVSALFSLLCGKLMYMISKKKLMVIAFAVFTGASIFCNAVPNAWYMAAMRTLIGASMGVTNTVAFAIIAENFVDEKSRSSMMGIYNSMIGVVGALLGAIAGIVAVQGWTLVFRIYLVAIPVLLMTVLFLPSDKVPGAEQKSESVPKEKMPWRKLMVMVAAFVIYNIVYCIVFYMIAVIVAEKGFGDAALIGALSALGTIGSFVASATFGLYYTKLKRFTVILSYAGMAVCYWLLYAATGSGLMIAGCTLLGAAYGLGMSYYMMYCTTFVPPPLIPLSISITTTAMSVGQFLSTYCASLLQGVMRVETLTETIPVLISILAAGAVLAAVNAVRSRKDAPASA